jgi:hypothetical protein
MTRSGGSEAEADIAIGVRKVTARLITNLRQRIEVASMGTLPARGNWEGPAQIGVCSKSD